MRFRSVVVLRKSQRLKCVILQPVICVDGLCWIDTLEWFNPFFCHKATDGAIVRTIGVAVELKLDCDYERRRTGTHDSATRAVLLDLDFLEEFSGLEPRFRLLESFEVGAELSFGALLFVLSFLFFFSSSKESESELESELELELESELELELELELEDESESEESVDFLAFLSFFTFAVFFFFFFLSPEASESESESELESELELLEEESDSELEEVSEDESDFLEALMEGDFGDLGEASLEEDFLEASLSLSEDEDDLEEALVCFTEMSESELELELESSFFLSRISIVLVMGYAINWRRTQPHSRLPYCR